MSMSQGQHPLCAVHLLFHPAEGLLLEIVRQLSKSAILGVIEREAPVSKITGFLNFPLP